jgi:hypothetical protein
MAREKLHGFFGLGSGCIRCAYTRRVTFGEEWPRISCTISIGTPPANISEHAPCRVVDPEEITFPALGFAMRGECVLGQARPAAPIGGDQGGAD